MVTFPAPFSENPADWVMVHRRTIYRLPMVFWTSQTPVQPIRRVRRGLGV